MLTPMDTQLINTIQLILQGGGWTVTRTDVDPTRITLTITHDRPASPPPHARRAERPDFS